MILTNFDRSFLGGGGVAVLYWVEKRSSCGHLLEHWESYGTNITMRGLIVRQLCEGRNRKTNT